MSRAARQWAWGLGAAVWVFGTVFWGFWPREETGPSGVAECHVPWLAVFGSMAVSLVGSWWIADLRRDPRFRLVFGACVLLWLSLAIAWPLLNGNVCDSGG